MLLRYRFGDYTLDTQCYELRRAGELVPLRPKVLHVLLYLLAHRDRVIPKQELMEQVWPGQFISDETLSTCVTEVRQALGDSGQRQGTIQTRRGLGFRFVVAVTVHDDRDAAAVVPFPLPPPETPPAPPDPLADTPTGEHKPVTVLVGTVPHAATLAVRLDPETLHQARQRLFTVVLEEVQRYGGTVHHLLDDGFLALFGAPLAQEDHARRAVLAAVDLRQRWQSQGADMGRGSDVILPLSLGLHTGSVLVDRLGATPRLTYTAVGDTHAVATGLARQAAPGTIWLSDATRRLVEGYVHLEAEPPVAVPGQPQPVSAYAVLGRGPRRSPLVTQGSRPLSRFVGRARELATLQALLTHVEAGKGQVVGILTCGMTERDDAAAMATKLQRRLQDVGMPAEAGGPYLLHLLGSTAGADQLAGLSPEAIRARTFATLHAFLRHSSQQRPLLLEIEDLHWIDPTSEAYVLELVEQMAGLPLLLLVTFRQGYRPQWMDKSYATQLALPPLAPMDSRCLVQAVLGSQPVSAPLLQTILAKAQGNPFFLEELARAVQDQGALRVPDTVQAVLAARLDRLPATAKQLLQQAAVIGAEVPLPLLQAVVARPEEELRDPLRHLQSAELLVETRRFPAPIYAFKHALIQDVAYQSMLTSTRQQVHRQVAQVLTERFPDTVERQPEVLAQHYTEAGLTAQALDYWYRAGARAHRHSAYAEAVAHCTRGLEVLKTLPETSERIRHELRLLSMLRNPLAVTRGYAAPEVEQVNTRVRALCQQIEEPLLRAQALGGLWTFYVNRELRTALELAEQNLALAERLQRSNALVWGHVMVGETLVFMGEFARALVYADKGLALYDPQQHRPQVSGSQQDPAVSALRDAALALWHLGYPDQASHRMHRALALAQKLAHPYSLVWTLIETALIHVLRRDFQTAGECATAGSALAAEQGFQVYAVLGTMIRGWQWLEQGQVEEAIGQICQGLDAYRQRGARTRMAAWLGYLADAYGRLGQLDDGLRLIAEALTVMDESDFRWSEAEVYRIKGELLSRDGARHTWAAAEGCFQQALDVARRQQARSLELRAALSLSRLWQRQGKRAAARALLAGVYQWFTEGFDTADLRDARALLETL